MSDTGDNGLEELRRHVRELRDAVDHVKDGRDRWQPPSMVSLPAEASSWNFTTFEKYINQRFGDLSLQLRERYEAQQTGVTAALAAAEKAVNAALIAAEKAVDKAEGAQQLRNVAQNEFRQSLADLSKLMWTRTEGTDKVESVSREISASVGSIVERVNKLETGYSNIQGRMWSVGAVWSVIVLVVMGTISFLHH
jgi:hypothetical protein